VDDALARARSFLALVRGEDDCELEKSLWGSPAGKRHLAKRIVAAIPRHRVYVEPFAGGAQVFWAKEPSEVEVLADRDPDIAFAFRFVKGLTPKKLERLKRKSWVGDAERFRKLYESNPEDEVDRFYRFAYLAHFSFNKLRRGTMPQKNVGVESRFVERLEALAPRLKHVEVRCADYEDVVAEFDGPDTFFFLDPPYPGYEAEVGHDDWDEGRFGKVLRRIDGKFLVTYGTRSEGADELFKGFHVERWRHTSGVGAHQGQGLRKSVTLVATNYRIHKTDEVEGARQLLLPSVPAPEPIDKTIWGSPAGKKRLAARLIKLIPPHKVYVEPFAGSAAVFFEKEPAEVEVLGDADPEIAAAFKAIKTLTGDELEALRKKDWVGRERTFKALLDARPRSKVEKLYRFLYLAHFSYGKLRGKSFNPGADGARARTIDRIEAFRDRLRTAKVRHAHYAELVKEFDGPETFFYLDPPYPGHNVEIGEDTFDEVEFRKVLEGIKGKFLVTYGTRGELDTKGFHVRKIRPPRSIRAMRGVGGPKTLPTLLIANYAITEKSLGTGDLRWTLEPVDGVLELDADLAADLSRARELAKALADGPSPSAEVTALAEALAAIEPVASAAELGADLLDAADRVAPALAEHAPAIARAFTDAVPALEALSATAKAEWTRAYINDLPDSAFLYIEPGGEKDDEGKTVPRSLRRFPVRNHLGRLDVPHLRNALARIPPADAQGLTADKKRALQEEARRLLEEAQDAEGVEKAKRVPFNQWGGSAKYAKKLAERLPEHDRYVEPFCGSAALFFAKEPAAEEVLADADPEVVFAHRFIQRLDDRSFAALKRFTWKVSRAGFQRARECEPRSDAERFWKLAYGRQCAWGGKSNMSGFSTIHEGQTYDIEELWRFHERLKGARLVTKDWKETLAECDGPRTLFFIDPPYVEEWDMESGIPPEDIAAEVAKLEGDYVIAYTDSARARRALRKVGRPFKMRFLEARHAGLWKTRSRLFVASCKLRKLDDVDWLDEPEAGVANDPAVAKALEAALARPIPLLKTDEERYVLGVVLEPETVDAQKDIYSAAEVREAAHRFMEEYRNLGLMHRELVTGRVKILESYLAPADFAVGDARVKKGTWLLAVRVVDDEMWKQVKSGDLTGFSIGGSAVKYPERNR
jgi:site-specific DNA-adenine methylase